MFFWPEEFKRSQFSNGTIHDLLSLLDEVPFSVNLDASTHRARLRAPIGEMGDKKWWRLIGNGAFSVKSFYNLLNDGELRCPIARFLWRNTCLKKINIFNWFA